MGRGPDPDPDGVNRVVSFEELWAFVGLLFAAGLLDLAANNSYDLLVVASIVTGLLFVANSE